MKRILFVHKSLCIGGAEQVLLKYLQICSARADWHITLLLHQCLSHNINIEAIPSNVSIVFLLSKKESRRLEQIEQKMENPNTDFDFLNYRNLLHNRIADFLTHNPVDLIINYNTHFDLFLEKFQMRIPVVRFIHGIVHLELWYGSPEYYQHILKKHSALIAICDEMHELMRWVLDKLDLQISTYTLYNPFDANEIREKAQQIPDNSQDRALLAQPFLLQVARLTPKKNHHQLIQMFAQLKQQGLPYKLYIIGDGEQYSELSAQIQALHLQNECLLLGERQNPYPFMQQATLFLHTSQQEGLPSVLIESMACGTPVVAMSCRTGVTEILENGRYGELIPEGDEKAFLFAVSRLLKDRNYYEQRKQTISDALFRFSTSTIQKKVYTIFDQVLAKEMQ